MRHPSIRPIKSPGRTITKRTPERIGQTTLISRKSSTKKMRLICRGRTGLRPRAEFTPEGQHRGAFLLSGHPLVLRHKHMIHIIGMAGLVPAIQVSASRRSARRGCGDARIKSGHEELGGTMHHLNESQH
jgi:hypothetical protein